MFLFFLQLELNAQFMFNHLKCLLNRRHLQKIQEEWLVNFPIIIIIFHNDKWKNWRTLLYLHGKYPSQKMLLQNVDFFSFAISARMTLSSHENPDNKVFRKYVDSAWSWFHLFIQIESISAFLSYTKLKEVLNFQE